MKRPTGSDAKTRHGAGWGGKGSIRKEYVPYQTGRSKYVPHQGKKEMARRISA